MTRYRKMVEREDGWCDWIAPEAFYKMACCDCGLVHNLQFKVVRQIGRPDQHGYWKSAEPKEPSLQVVFRAQRNARATAAMRRKRK